MSAIATTRARRRRGSAGVRAATRPWHTRRGLLIFGAVAYLVTFLILLPLLWVGLLSFRSTSSILEDPIALWPLDLDNYARVFRTLPLGEMYGNTLLLALTSVAVGTVVSFMSSYALSRIIFRRWRFLQSSARIYLLAGLAIPVYILLFPIYRIVIALGLFGSHLSLILPYIAVTLPFNTLLFTGFLADFPPEVEEAAIVDGVGLWRMFTSVVVPLMRPVIATVLIFNIIYVFNEYPFVSILSSTQTINTVSLAVSQFQGQYSADYGAMMAASTLILVPQIAIYAIFQKQVIAGITAGAVKG